MSRRAGLGLTLALLASSPSEGPAQTPSAAQVTVAPAAVRLGERAMVRATIVVGPGTRAQWLPPDSSETLTWGERRAWRHPAVAGGGARRQAQDTIGVEVPVQAFQLGSNALPGLEVVVGAGSSAQTYRLPGASLVVLPTISPADSQATLKPVRGPLAAPWWERVPWTWVAAGLLLLAGIVALIRRLRRRRRPAPAAAPAPSRSPSEIALAALAELRAQRLPENGRMAEHAFRLGQILRRYLEATTRTTMPGHTTPELVRSLAEAGLPPEDRQRLTGLLRIWDRVKFARAPLTLEEAVRSEQAVESFVRRPPVSSPGEPQRGAA